MNTHWDGKKHGASKAFRSKGLCRKGGVMNQIKYVKRKTKYELDEDYIVKTPIIGHEINTPMISLTLVGVLTVRSGFGFDPSGPTIDTPAGIFGSCAHDAFFWLMIRGLLPLSEFDNVNLFFDEQLDEGGMSELRSEIWQKGVELFSKSSADPKNKPEILTAP